MKYSFRRIHWKKLPHLPACFAVAMSCVPSFEDDTTRIEETRILALRTDPAEPRPGESIRLTALVASANPDEGSEDDEELAWYACTARRPATELGPVAQECLTDFGAPSEVLEPVGNGPSVEWVVAGDACRRFGPLPPPTDNEGASPASPASPDQTGGYFQPIVVGTPIETANEPYLGVVRLLCGGAGLPQEELVTFNRGYRPNENPEIEELRADLDGTPLNLDGGDPLEIEVGSQLTWTVSWASCPKQAVCGDGLCTAGENANSCIEDCEGESVSGCTGAEAYLLNDPQTKTVVERIETLQVSWFATEGAFEFSTTDNTDSETASSNVWTAPSTPTAVRLWIVVRDSRRGTTWREIEIVVKSR